MKAQQIREDLYLVLSVHELLLAHRDSLEEILEEMEVPMLTYNSAIRRLEVIGGLDV